MRFLANHTLWGVRGTQHQGRGDAGLGEGVVGRSEDGGGGKGSELVRGI